MKKNLHISKTVCLIAIFSLLSFTTFSQVNRSFTGEGNNLQHPEWGAKGTNQLRVTPATYSDGVSEPTGLNRPNPRYISNTIFNQDGLIPDALTISDYAFVWGQFIDHNITLVLDSESDYYPIPVPGGDPYFDPFNVGTAQIPFFRSAPDPATGTSPANPREFPNAISSFIDGSGVYGSTQARADWLRTFENGRLRMSSGQLLPYNTVTGELGSPIDPNAPVMAMANPNITKWFVAGDVRANENALLTAMHTLFVREHNRLCEVIKTENPSWNDEQIYQRARKIVGAEIEAIVYEEWLPTMGVNLGAYTGYDPVMEPGIMNVFSVAAYRYGHSVINSKIIRMNNAGEIIPQGNILLRDAFFNPNVIPEGGGIDPLLIGMGTQVEQDFDTKMIHDLRNFLFGFPGQGGMDLAAINIQRGRERGLVDYNSIRQVFGLPKLTSFDQISDDEWFNQTFQNVYGFIDDIDPWTGLLSESHMSNALFGETVMAIMKRQFNILRNGDRYYYENDPAFTADEINTIKQTRLKDIIMRNTGVNTMQENVFLMEPHEITGVSFRDESKLEVQVYPNPVTQKLFVNMAAPEAGEVSIQISDIEGVILDELHFDAQEGMNTFEFGIDQNLPSGFYLVSLIMDNKVGHRRIFKD